jgi:hypothetical protein
MVDLEWDNTQAYQNARMRTFLRRPIEIPLGLTGTGRIFYPLNDRCLRHPVDRAGRQHWKNLEEKDCRSGSGLYRSRQTGNEAKQAWCSLIIPGEKAFL